MATRPTLIRILVCLVAALLVAALQLSAQTSSGQKPLPGDKTAVNHACKTEAATEGCGNETVGHGLLKCIHAYKKAHPDFKIGQGCRQAMQHLRADRQASKHARKTTPPPQ